MIKFSKTNKLHAPAFGLPPKISCPVQGQICRVCYASTGTASFPSVASVLAENMAAVVQCGEDADKLTSLFLAVIPEKTRYFRWFWSGDCFSRTLAKAIHRISQARPDTAFWTSTRTDYFSGMANLPNLRVRVSSSRVNERIGNSRGTSTVLMPGTEPSSSRVHVCPGECGECRVCWNSSRPVAYRYHGSACGWARLKSLIKKGEF